MKRKLYVILWLDAVRGATSWHDAEDTKKFATATDGEVLSVGWLVHRDKDYFTIASDQSGTETGRLIKIPNGMIVRKWLVRVA